MATNASTSDPVCIACLESKELEGFSSCDHKICSGCLDKMIKNTKGEGAMVKCPVCITNTSEEELKIPTSQCKEIDTCGGGEEEEKDRTSQRRLPGNTYLCSRCYIKGVEIQGVVLCHACGLYMCKDCADKHSMIEANKQHVVVPLTFQKKKDEAICRSHGIPLTRYCLTCRTAICSVCVFDDHEQHSVECLADVIETKLTDVKEVLAKLEAVLEKFQEGREELLQLIDLAKENETYIDEAIEEHAERVIKAAQEWKAAMKKNLKDKFKVTPEMETVLTAHTKIIQDLEVPTMGASRTVSQDERNPEYLEKLTTLMDDLQDRLADVVGEVDISGHTEKVERLIKDGYSFSPEFVSSFGQIAKFRDLFQPQLLREHTIEWYQPCGTTVQFISMISDELYAVALTKNFNTYYIHFSVISSNALKYTFEVEKMCEMTATPDEMVAIILKKPDDGHLINVYNPENGTIVKVLNLSLSMEPLGMAVNSSYQFLLLGRKSFFVQLTVLDKEGGELTTCHLTRDYLLISADLRIACGGRYIFISGNGRFIGAYELTNDKIEHVTNMKNLHNQESQIWDIAGKNDGTLFAVNSSGFLHTYRRYGVSEWAKYVHQYRNISKSQGVRITTRDGYKLLLAEGTTIKLFKLLKTV